MTNWFTLFMPKGIAFDRIIIMDDCRLITNAIS